MPTIHNNIQSPNKQISKKPKTLIISLGIIGLVAAILVASIITPIIFIIIMLSIDCDAKMNKLDIQKEFVKKQINTLPDVQNTSSIINGDCLTASGISYSFTYNKPFSNAYIATEEITSKLNTLDIPVPKNATTPNYIEYSDGSGAVGGDTPIKKIRLEYIDNNTSNNLELRTFNVNIDLDHPLNCSYDQSIVLCNGVNRDILAKQILQTQPIESITIFSDVSTDLQ